MPDYCVRVSHEELVFSAAHLLVFGPEQCERLHGHNYRVSAEVHGPLDENFYVVDFAAVRQVLGELIERLDHRVLLPLQHRWLRVSEGADEVEVRLGQRRWVFPRGDCLLLPLRQTTAEALAGYLGELLLGRLGPMVGRPMRLRMEVEESFGQAAVWEAGAV